MFNSVTDMSAGVINIKQPLDAVLPIALGIIQTTIVYSEKVEKENETKI